MKIRLVGFRLTLNSLLPFPELWREMSKRSGKRVKFGGYDRILQVKDQGQYVLGCLFTVKGQNKVTQIDEKSLKMSIQQLAADKRLAVFNFFILSKKT